MFEKDIHLIVPKQAAIGSVIFLHGLGADNRNFESIVPMITNNGKLPLRFVFPNAPVRPVSVNQSWPARAWYDIYSLSDLNLEDERGLSSAAEFVESLIASEIENGIPSDRIVLGGFSQGGALALYTGIRYAERLAGMIALSCYLPLLQKEDPSARQNLNTPIFLSHGLHDIVLPMSLAQMTHNALIKNHKNVNWQEYAMGHEVSYEELGDMAKWLGRIFGDYID